MATKTANLGLTIIEDTDPVSQEPINANSKILDTEIKKLQDDTAEIGAMKQDISAAQSDITTLSGKVATTAQNISGLASSSKKYTDDQIAALVADAPAALDTLKELADKLASDDDSMAALVAQISNKVDKIAGKGLSTNDYDNTAKAKVDFLAVTKVANVDSLVENTHNHTNKGTIDKLGESNGTPTYNGDPLVGGARTWVASTNYQVSSLVVLNGMLYRCKTAHVSGNTFDTTNWDLLDIGYIPLWAAGQNYQPEMVVTRGNNIYRCITAHISFAWDNTQANYWEIIAGKGATLSQWQPNTDYTAGESVIYNDALYYALSDHHSSTNFSNDMLAGAEKWKTISMVGSAGALKQVNKLGVIAPYSSDIIILWTNTFLTPPVEFLKFIAGAKNQVFTECGFDNSDADDFIVDGVSGELYPWVIFDGTMRPKTSYAVVCTDPVTLADGKTAETDWIDFSIYQSLAAININ